MMRKLFLFFAAAFFSISASAAYEEVYREYIGGIYYDLVYRNDGGSYATVTQPFEVEVYNEETEEFDFILPEDYEGDIVIPSVVYDGNRAFPVTAIDDEAFGMMDIGGDPISYITSVTIPSSVTSIGERAFFLCNNLKSITIPNSVKSIGADAFDFCTSLTSFTMESTTPPNWKTDFFPDRAQATLYVPAGAKAAYMKASYWKDFKSIAEKVSEPAITFADAMVKAICVEHWDTNHDGELSYKEAAAVTNLGDAFCGSSITSFDEFQYFTGVTKLEIPSSGGDGSEIEWSMVDECNEESLSGTFASCGSLNNIIIPQNVRSFGKYAFANCTGLTSIEIPSGVNSIGEDAFYGCDGIKIIVKDLKAWCNTTLLRAGYHGELMPGMEYRTTSPLLSWYLYSDKDTPFTNLVIPDGTTVIRNGIFENCMNLTTVIIASSVKTMEYAAFYNCPNLSEVILEDGVLSIGEEAFKYCGKLASVTIPGSVTAIGGAAFSNCKDIKFIVKDLAAWCGIDFGNEHVYEGMPMVYPSNPLQTGYLYADEDTPVTNLVIPDGVSAITRSAFYGCQGLKSIKIPDSVTSIGAYAFAGVTGPASVVIPDGVTYIGSSAFDNSSLTSVTLGSSVEEICFYAFSCDGLASVIVNNPTPPSIGEIQGGDPGGRVLPAPDETPMCEDVFSNCANATLYVPKGTRAAFREADIWKGFKEIVEKGSSGGLKGDMNDDGVLDITDAMIIVDIILGKR